MTETSAAPRRRSSGNAPAAGELRRKLGVFSATLLVVGGIIGSGIFFTPSEVAKALPDGRWILGVWGVGGVVALAGALSYAEVGAMMPDAGGPYIYIREAFGKLPAFLYGWMLLLSIGSGALAAVAMGFAGYVARFVPLSHPEQVALAAVTMAVIAIVNYLGVVPGAVVQNIFTIAKIAALGIIIVGGAVLWSHLWRAAPVATAAPAPPTSLAVGFGQAFVPVLFTIGGWQQMNMVAGEIRDPGRTIPRALIYGILIVIACYLGANAIYLHALGRDGLAASSAVAADAATRIFGSTGGTFVAVAAMLSIFGFVSVTILATSRVVFAMGRDGVFLDAAARVHPRFGSPHVSIVIVALWSIALLLMTNGDVGTLLSAVVFADWIFFGLGGASVFVLRRTRADAPRPYRALGYPIIPAFFVLAAMVGVISSFVKSMKMSLLGTALIVLGVIVYYALQRRGARAPS